MSLRLQMVLLDNYTALSKIITLFLTSFGDQIYNILVLLNLKKKMCCFFFLKDSNKWEYRLIIHIFPSWAQIKYIRKLFSCAAELLSHNQEHRLLEAKRQASQSSNNR